METSCPHCLPPLHQCPGEGYSHSFLEIPGVPRDKRMGFPPLAEAGCDSWGTTRCCSLWAWDVSAYCMLSLPFCAPFFVFTPVYFCILVQQTPTEQHLVCWFFCFCCTSSLLLLLYPLPCPASHQSRVQACWGPLPEGTELIALWSSWTGSWSLCSVSGKDGDGWCG